MKLTAEQKQVLRLLRQGPLKVLATYEPASALVNAGLAAVKPSQKELEFEAQSGASIRTLTITNAGRSVVQTRPERSGT